MKNIPASQKIKEQHWQRSNKETIFDLQTCKIIDSIVEKTMTTS